MNIDQRLDAAEARRFASQDRYLKRLEKREKKAEEMIGILCREGKEVLYVWPQGGKYREGERHDLIAFLIRNKYA